MQRRIIAAWALIILGSLLLLNQLAIFQLTRASFISIASLFIGFILFSRGWNHPLHKGILSGSFFILFGLFILLMQLDFIPLNDSVGIGIILISLGLANIIFFAFRRIKFTNLIWGVIFLILGAPFIANYYYYISYWELEEIFSKYWPVLIILVGIGLLGEGIIKNWRKNSRKEIKAI